MRKVASHTHYVTGTMSEDESGPSPDDSMHPEFGHTGGHPDTVTTIGARFAGQKRGRATRRPAPPPSDDE